MTSNKPYLLRAFFDWILDNDCTPHIVINANLPNVLVPVQFVQDGQIVLNINPSAVTHFNMDNYEVSFNARFGGQPMRVVVPINAVLAIYARENGEGTVFTAEEFVEQSDDFDVQIEQTNAPVDDKKPEEKPVSHLKVIK
jgi:stringent starvation protein B